MRWRYKHPGDNYEQEFETKETEIHRAAEDIAEEYDQQYAEYPDEREFELWCPKQKRWRTIWVYAENVRSYSAHETNESLNRELPGEGK